jgi:hypothetical protein
VVPGGGLCEKLPQRRPHARGGERADGGRRGHERVFFAADVRLHHRRGSRGIRCCHRHGDDFSRRRYLDDGSHEAIAAARNRGDESRLPGVVAQGAANRQHCLRQHIVRHRLVRPDLADQLVLRHDAGAIGKEEHQRFPRPRADRDRFAVAKQLARREIDAEPANGVAADRWR